MCTLQVVHNCIELKVLNVDGTRGEKNIANEGLVVFLYVSSKGNSVSDFCCCPATKALGTRLVPCYHQLSDCRNLVQCLRCPQA